MSEVKFQLELCTNSLGKPRKVVPHFFSTLYITGQDWASGAFIFTFVQLFFIWTLEAITIILENPFDTSDPNCIDVFQLQLGTLDKVIRSAK